MLMNIFTDHLSFMSIFFSNQIDLLYYYITTMIVQKIVHKNNLIKNNTHFTYLPNFVLNLQILLHDYLS